MNNPSSANYNQQIPAHPEDYWKDEWVLSRHSTKGGGLIVDRHTEPPDEIETGGTSHHIIGYLLSEFAPRQITRMDGKEYDGVNKRGDIWLKPADTDAFWYWESTDECLIFSIKPDWLGRIALENDFLNPDKIEILPVLKTCDLKLELLANEFYLEMNNNGFGSKLYIESLANIFAVHILRNYCTFCAKTQEYLGGLSPYQKQRAIDYIQAHLGRELGLTEVSQLVGLSQYHFVRQFKKSVGITPHQYVMQQRVEMAKRMLKRQTIPLSDIAFDCGFSNQSHLGRVFKRYTGTTPKRYQQEFI